MLFASTRGSSSRCRPSSKAAHAGPHRRIPGETVSSPLAARWATGLHQVDNPVFDRAGNLFVTYSGSRGQEAPVSVFRVTPAGTREPFVSGIVNATSMAIGPDGRLYVSSRFEGAVYRVKDDGSHEQVASDLGVACGLAFDADGSMYVGDRSGTIFRVRDGAATPFATLPPSVAAFHLAMSPTGELFVSAPTLGTYDHIYRIDRDWRGAHAATPLRPAAGAGVLAGRCRCTSSTRWPAASGLYRFADPDGEPELVVIGRRARRRGLRPGRRAVVASNETAYRFDVTPVPSMALYLPWSRMR